MEGQSPLRSETAMGGAQDAFAGLQKYMNEQIIGQEKLVERLLIALLADGHLLVEGAPGLAKTKAIKALSSAVEGEENRIQFTPDLLPADLTGSDIFRPEDGSFVFQKGPIFNNFILADEINRAPAKVQSALLEAMGERQVTAGRKTHNLSPLFLVMATQNPIEQEGTYPLPEAQLDRFLLYIRIDYPQAESEKKILQLVRTEAKGTAAEPVKKVPQKTVFAARSQVLDVHLSEALEEYLVQLVLATREPAPYGNELPAWIHCGASPRGTIALDRCARACAWLNGRDYVSPEDVHAVAYDVLRHRVLLTFEAEAKGVTTDNFISILLNRVPLP